jgi:hypothetical protein
VAPYVSGFIRVDERNQFKMKKCHKVSQPEADPPLADKSQKETIIVLVFLHS